MERPLPDVGDPPETAGEVGGAAHRSGGWAGRIRARTGRALATPPIEREPAPGDEHHHDARDEHPVRRTTTVPRIPSAEPVLPPETGGAVERFRDRGGPRAAAAGTLPAP